MSKEKSKSTLIKDAITLFIITLIAGLALGFIYELTKGPIEDANAKAKQKAYLSVYADATEFVEDDAINAKVKESEKFLKDHDLSGAEISEVLIAKNDSGEAIGYVISYLATEGYGGNISISMGMTNEGEITGLEILSASETPGLGAKCKESAFKDQFKGISADSIEYTKDGATEDNQIDAISGATITTKAVTKGVNAAIAFLKQDVMQG